MRQLNHLQIILLARVQKDINDGNTIIGGIFTSTNRALDANLSDIIA